MDGGKVLTQKDKLIKRLKARPKNFTFEETEALLYYFGYRRSEKGKTSGSRVMFIHEIYKPIMMHKPHPRKELLAAQVNQLIKQLEQEGLL